MIALLVAMGVAPIAFIVFLEVSARRAARRDLEQYNATMNAERAKQGLRPIPGPGRPGGI